MSCLLVPWRCGLGAAGGLGQLPAEAPDTEGSLPGLHGTEDTDAEFPERPLVGHGLHALPGGHADRGTFSGPEIL